jgi:hypothetical protein
MTRRVSMVEGQVWHGVIVPEADASLRLAGS